MQSSHLKLAGISLATFITVIVQGADSFTWQVSKTTAMQQAVAERKLVFLVAGKHT